MATFVIDDLVFNDNVSRRYWGKVAIGDPDECWVWTATNYQGYGRFRIKSSSDKWLTIASHRMSLYLSERTSGKGYIACHKCNNPPCCNPNHLYWGTPADNTKDSIKAGTFKRAKNPIKINKEDRDWIYEQLIHERFKGSELAKMFNVSQSTISNIKHNVYTYINEVEK